MGTIQNLNSTKPTPLDVTVVKLSESNMKKYIWFIFFFCFHFNQCSAFFVFLLHLPMFRPPQNWLLQQADVSLQHIRSTVAWEQGDCCFLILSCSQSTEKNIHFVCVALMQQAFWNTRTEINIQCHSWGLSKNVTVSKNFLLRLKMHPRWVSVQFRLRICLKKQTSCVQH